MTRAIYDDMVRNLSDSSSDEGPWVRTTTFRGTPFSGKGPQSAWTSPPPKPKPSTSSSSSSRVPPPRQPAGPPPGYREHMGKHRPLEEMGPCRQSHLPPRKIAYRGAGATLVAMAAVEAETLGWQKRGSVPQKGRARDQHRSRLTGRARAEDPVSRHEAFLQGASSVLGTEAAKSASSSTEAPSEAR